MPILILLLITTAVVYIYVPLLTAVVSVPVSGSHKSPSFSETSSDVSFPTCASREGGEIVEREGEALTANPLLQ